MAARKTSFQDASDDLFALTPGALSAPVGFRYAPDLFSPAAEQDFVATFQTLPFKPFEFHGYQGNRRIVSYRYRYDYAGRALRASEAMPDFLAPLRKLASQFSGIPSEKLEQALVTEYAPEAGIGWHRDKPMFEEVVALSFLAPCVLRLRRQNGSDWERRAVEIAARSGYLLQITCAEPRVSGMPTGRSDGSRQCLKSAAIKPLFFRSAQSGEIPPAP